MQILVLLDRGFAYSEILEMEESEFEAYVNLSIDLNKGRRFSR